MKTASCGLDVNFPTEVRGVLKSAFNHGFEFVCLPLVHPRFKREFTEKWKDRQGPFTRPDLVLTSSDWNTLIAGKISPYLNLDSELFKGQDKFALEQELNYGCHLDVPALIISLRSAKCYNLARIINSNLSVLKPYQIWVEIPLVSHTEAASVWRSDVSQQEGSTWQWLTTYYWILLETFRSFVVNATCALPAALTHAAADNEGDNLLLWMNQHNFFQLPPTRWTTFRTLCNSDKRLGVILELSNFLPNQEELKRWMGEPIKCLVISTSTFLTNKKGYPVLSRALQAFIKTLVPTDVQVIIKGNNHHYSLDCYQKYINHLWQEAIVQQNSKLEDVSCNEHSIHSSLQSFAGSMSKSYEIFEKDSVKYKAYTLAIYKAILDQVKEDDKDSKTLNVMIVGAGKGALIIATLGAAANAGRKVKVYAVEKNPHAVVTLKAYQEELWHDSVEIICEEIKSLKLPQKVDIVLTDTLGSFGDNELSPEITDLAQKFLKKGGVSIPEMYVSHVCPVQGSKMYSDLKASKEKSECEIPYSFAQKYKYDISEVKPVFSFYHPNYSEPIDNSRYISLNFEVEQNCTLHGFTGYFETYLYKDIKLSIVPKTQTPGLCTWNPIFFPLMEPVQLKTGDELEVHFWRIVGRSSVWYEWTITSPIPLPVHNPNGRSSNVPLP